MKKKIFALLLCVTMLSGTIVFAQEAEINNPDTATISSIRDAMDVSSEEAKRTNDLFSNKISEMESLSEEEISLSVDTVKALKDFADNQYILIECAPQGFMIYHAESGRFSEYSPQSPSPYRDYDDNGDLYYGGPTYYYVREGNEFRHTVTDERIPCTDKTDFSAKSNDVVEYYLDNADSEVVNYVKNGSRDVQSSLNARPMGTTFFVQNAAQLSSLTTEKQIGYFHTGACGYIATGLLLLWHKTTINNNYVGANSSGRSYTSVINGLTQFNGDPNNFTNGQTFSYNLYRWHSPKGTSGDYSTTGWDLKDTLESYLPNKNINAALSLDTMPTSTGIRVFMTTWDRPILLGGNLTAKDSGKTKGWHFCTVYGYYDEGWTNYLIAHFGWKDYSCNYVDGIWTQTLGIKYE